MNRRKFLGALNVTVFMLMFPARILAKKDEEEKDFAVRNNLKRFFSSVYSAQNVGEKYLRSLPKQAGRYSTIQLSLRKKYKNPLHTYCGDDFIKITSDIIRKDFECNEVIMVEGWYLSSTEVNLCALSTLLKDPLCI